MTPRPPHARTLALLSLVTLAAALGPSLSSTASLAAQDTLAPPDIVWIPEGAFTMRADDADLQYAVQLCQDEHELTLADGCGVERFAHERHAERVYLSRYGLDRLEVSRARWQACVDAGACAPSRIDDDDPELGGPSLPVAGVDARQAERYCAFRGGRLPTEAEWEKAARGADDDRRFPWGHVYDGGLANHGRPMLRPDASDGYRGLAPVGALGGVSPYGLRDMAGNVWEWTCSPPRAVDLGRPTRPGDRERVVRGGSYLHPAVSMRVTARSWLDEGSARTDLGLRCAYDAPERARGR